MPPLGFADALRWLSREEQGQKRAAVTREPCQGSRLPAWATSRASSQPAAAAGEGLLADGHSPPGKPGSTAARVQFRLSPPLSPRTKPACHRAAAAAGSPGPHHPLRGSGLKSPLVSHPRMLALTPLRPLHPSPWLPEHRAGLLPHRDLCWGERRGSGAQGALGRGAEGGDTSLGQQRVVEVSAAGGRETHLFR